MVGTDTMHYETINCISDPSDAISTSLRSFLLIFYLPLPFEQKNIVPLSPRLRKTSDRLDLTRTAFYCVIRPYPSYLDLDTLRSTSFYCVILIILRFSSRFISFTSISLSILLHTSDCIYRHITHLHLPYPITIEPDTPFNTPFFIGHIGTDYQ